MIDYRWCGASRKGKSHEINGLPCQDSSCILVGKGFIVAAVADGLGSSKHSDKASYIAANNAANYCAKNIHVGMSDANIQKIIKQAFDKANFTIKVTARDNLDDYDTTLTLAVFMDGEIHYGHAGDSGIIAVRSDGIFEQVTQPSLGDGQGSERPVHPLAAESHWVFGKYDQPTKAIFLMTDGVLNKVIPPLLEDQRYKMDNSYLYYLYDNLEKSHDLEKWIDTELNKINPQEVNYDDKTIIAVICISQEIILQQQSYYQFPDEELWNYLIDEHKSSLYPYRKAQPEAFPKSVIARTPLKVPPKKSIGTIPIRERKRRKSNALMKACLASFLLGVVSMLLIWFITASISSNGYTVNLTENFLNPRIGDELNIYVKGDESGRFEFVWMGDETFYEGNYYVLREDVDQPIRLWIRCHETRFRMRIWTPSVQKKEGPEAPSAPSYTYLSFERVVLERESDDDIEYEFLVLPAGYTGEEESINWQISNIFEGLSYGETYHFYRRIVATDYRKASEKSDALVVTIE